MKKINSLALVLILSLWSATLNAQLKETVKGLDLLSNVETITKNVDNIVTKIDGVVDKVQDNGTYKTVVDGFSGTFPYGVIPSNGDRRYALYVSEVKIDPLRGALASIYMKIPIKQTESLYFMADQVPISQSGAIVGDFNLLLLKDADLSFGTEKGYNLKFKGLTSGKTDSTFVTIDCKGFKSITMAGELAFNTSSVVKYREGDKGSKEPYVLKFNTYASNFEDLYLEFTNVKPFEFAFLPGYKCEVETIIIDNSDAKNAPEFKVPDDFKDNVTASSIGDPDFSKDLTNLWKGVYIKNMKVTIPKAFTEGARSTSGTSAVTINGSINVESLIVDRTGVTGLIRAVGNRFDDKNNRLDNGHAFIEANIKGFEFAIDEFAIGMEKNIINQSAIKGSMTMPVTKANKESEVTFNLGMNQNATRDDMNYYGSTKFEINKTLKMPALGAQLRLSGEQEFALNYENKQFFPSVTLNGELIATTKKVDESKQDDDPQDNKGDLLTLEFSGLLIESRAPYLSLKGQSITELAEQAATDLAKKKLGEATKTTYASYFRMKKDAESKLGGLPISITEVGLVKNSTKGTTGVNVGVQLMLQGSGGDDSQASNGFCAATNFTVWGKRDLTSRRWKYADFNLNAINLDINQTSFSLKGSLQRFDSDVVYGTGFCGDMNLVVIDKIDVSAAAIFGATETTATTTTTTAMAGYRYWFVDASVTLPVGIPLGVGIELNTFTGGIYHQMSRNDTEKLKTTVDCKTASGRVYKPNSSVYLGLLAGVGVQSTGGGTAFNGKVNFGIEFNNIGGVNSIATWGDVKFMDFSFKAPGLDDLSKKVKSATPLNSATAETVKKKTTPDGDVASSALWANWYVGYNFPKKTLDGNFSLYMNLAGVVKGRGANNLAGKIDLHASPDKWFVYAGTPVDMMGVNVINLVDIGAYYCLGSVLPTPPIAPLPSEVKSKNFNAIDNNLLIGGSGFSFGSRLDIGGEYGVTLGPCSLRPYARFKFMSGYDMLLAQSVAAVPCKGTDIMQRGINNWYATGQAYFYGDVAIGARYSCFLGSGGGDLFGLTATGVLQTQLPNPSFMTGNLRTSIRIMKKSFGFEVKVNLGKQCETNTLTNNVDFIKTITPTDGSTSVNVAEPIRVSLNYALEKFSYTINSGGGDVTYRKILQDDSYIQLSYKTGDQVEVIPFTYTMNNDNQEILITPSKVLPENSVVNVSLTLHTQTKKGESWSTLDDDLATEEFSATFITGNESETIAASDVLHAYPLPNMKNLYKDESSQGHIKLAVLPTKPVTLNTELKEAFNVVILKGNYEVARDKTVTYDGKGQFDFDLPSMYLKPNTSYTLKLVKAIPQDGATQKATVSNNYTTGAVAVDNRDKVVLTYDFTTSAYNTFAEKMATYKPALSQMFNGKIQTVMTGVTQESLSSEEGSGYYGGHGKGADRLIRFGKTIQVNGTPIDNISFDFIENEGQTTTVTDAYEKVNLAMREMNMKCLLEGNCSSADQPKMEIPMGELLIPVGYFIPGHKEPSSTINFTVKLAEKVNLPK